MIYVFVIAVFLLLYSFFGYPLTLFFLAAFFERRKRTFTPNYYPKVMLVFPCCWEGNRLQNKIENCLKIEYPEDKLDIVAVADGPTPETLKVLKDAERNGKLRLLVNSTRSGKGVALAMAHKQCKYEILVVTDADTLLEPNHLKELIAPFKDREVGATSGTFYYGNIGDSGISHNEGIYWKFEMITRKAESLLGKSITVTGAIYAVRTHLFTLDDPLSPDDFLAGVQPREQGKQVFLLDGIRTRDYSASSGRSVFKRRVRTITRGMGLLARNPRYISPFHFPFLAFQIFCHKIIRWLLPVLLLLILISNVFLAFCNVFWLFTLAGQMLFYVAGLAGGLLAKKNRRVPIASSIWYFLVSCTASLVAIFYFLTGKKFAVWGQTAQK